MNLREAAENLVKAFEYDYTEPTKWKAIKALRQALAQQDKECVAIVNEGMGGIEWLSPCLPDDTPLYTAPPKRKWAGLTREEFEEATKGLEDLEDCWVAIEAKLKEKNG